MPLKILRAVLAAVVLATALAGCASNPDAATGADYDPLEPVNRKVFVFNETVDEYVLNPAAQAWTAITPSELRQGVSNFYNNLSYPGVIVNDLLQGKPDYAAEDTLRFVVNTTLGIGGLFDPAASMGLPSRSEDFGQTLGVWGSDPGPYLVLPLFGPSNARDVTRYPVGVYTTVITYASLDILTFGALTALNVINTRAQLDRAVRLRDEAALDPYNFTRSSYNQYRRNQIYDGNPPQEEDPYGDFFNELENEGDDSEPRSEN